MRALDKIASDGICIVISNVNGTVFCVHALQERKILTIGENNVITTVF